MREWFRIKDGEEKGRFSIIGLNPDKILKLKDKTITVEENDRETIISEGNVNQKIRNFISENTFEFSDKFRRPLLLKFRTKSINVYL